MEIPKNLLCLFTAQLEKEADGSYVIEVPAQDVTKGQLEPNEKYRIAVLRTEASPPEDQEEASNTIEQTQGPTESESPVEIGEKRTVEIESIGEQGDGIARIERGYVVIVPDTEVHERVTIEIKNASPNVAFGEVTERHDYYE
ncbi:TRAM domain-containing protein [Natrinema halophilum]|uniref:TRAM domain-containing protein n=1 Tax=Natrinema halophilum TaxID=1699371 RepID=UPI001F24FD3B|nr:TRAM domain-containing protein [Natrinema halophilum]UHQ96250.1 TRAM domain-containing protein [Natrinema halophilum]